jgi:hypothetical protein
MNLTVLKATVTPPGRTDAVWENLIVADIFVSKQTQQAIENRCEVPGNGQNNPNSGHRSATDVMHRK